MARDKIEVAESGQRFCRKGHAKGHGKAGPLSLIRAVASPFEEGATDFASCGFRNSGECLVVPAVVCHEGRQLDCRPFLCLEISVNVIYNRCSNELSDN